VPLLIAGDPDALVALVPYVTSLAKVSTVEIVEDLPATDRARAGGRRNALMLHIEIDVVAERQRLAKGDHAPGSGAGKASAKLGKRDLRGARACGGRRAAAALAAGLQSTLEQLRAQRARLSG